jgi:superfamily II DNA or RNA helicase
LRLAPGKLGVTFDTDVDSATETAAAFRAAGVPAEVVSAKTPDALRAQILRRFKNREILQLVNVDLFGEGFDLPAIEVVSFARATESFALYCQQFGRALRLMLAAAAAAVHADLTDEGRRAAIAAMAWAR